PHLPDVDAWGLGGSGETFAFVVLPFRHGRLRKPILLSGSPESLTSALRRHYKKKDTLPPSILIVPFGPEDTAVMTLWSRVMERLDPALQPRLCRAEEDEQWSAAAELVRLNLPVLNSSR
ncbi:MAG: hypothetical protein M3Y56_16360, partial [Armatimonadota bacterium]|nr:hypothetical protein [Armatimonadota bacterium]